MHVHAQECHGPVNCVLALRLIAASVLVMIVSASAPAATMVAAGGTAGAKEAAGGSPAAAEARFERAQALFVEAKQLQSASDTDPLAARQRFRRAAEAFASLADDGVVTANVCVNAGNAYHFAGDQPRALLWYLRAAELENSDEIRNAVTTLRRSCGGELRAPTKGSIRLALLSWHYGPGARTKQLILLASYPLGCALVLVSVWRAKRPGVMKTGMALMAIGLVFGGSYLVGECVPRQTWGVVLEPTSGRSGDGRNYSLVRDRIVAGQEVTIIERRGDWTRIQLPSGLSCWLESELCPAI